MTVYLLSSCFFDILYILYEPRLADSVAPVFLSPFDLSLAMHSRYVRARVNTGSSRHLTSQVFIDINTPREAGAHVASLNDFRRSAKTGGER
jgi:hypothetical protein